MGSEALDGNRWGTPMDGSPRLGLPREDLSPFRSRLTAAGPAGLDAGRRMAADLCGSLSPAQLQPRNRKHTEQYQRGERVAKDETIDSSFRQNLRRPEIVPSIAVWPEADSRVASVRIDIAEIGVKAGCALALCKDALAQGGRRRTGVTAASRFSGGVKTAPIAATVLRLRTIPATDTG